MAAIGLAASSVVQADWISDGSYVVQKINEGIMLSMQNNPNSTNGNACKDQIVAANAEVANMLNFSAYPSGNFNFGELLNKAQIMMFKLQGEFELCGYDQFLISFDELMSTWGALSGGLASLAT